MTVTQLVAESEAELTQEYYVRTSSALAVNVSVIPQTANTFAHINWISCSSKTGHTFELKSDGNRLIITACPAYGYAFADFNDNPRIISLHSAPLLLDTNQLGAGEHHITIGYTLVGT